MDEAPAAMPALPLAEPLPAVLLEAAGVTLGNWPGSCCRGTLSRSPVPTDAASSGVVLTRAAGDAAFG